MGSAKVSNATPQIPVMADKKSIKRFLKDFFRKDKKKDKDEKAKEDVVEPPKPPACSTVEAILQKIQKLELREEEGEDGDELRHFSFKAVSGEARPERSISNSSEDSGFSNKYEVDDKLKESEGECKDDDKDRESEEEDDDDVTGDFQKLSIDEGKKRKNKIVVTRAPLRNKSEVCKQIRPYNVQLTDNCRQVQINKNSLTGGQVIVNPNKHNDFLEFDNALKQVQQSSQFSQHEHGGDWLNIVTEYIQEVSTKPDAVEDILSEFLQAQECQDDNPILTPPHQLVEKRQELNTNPIEEFSNHVQYEQYADLDLTSLNDYVDMPSLQYFPTPPHSENASSPMSDQSYRNSDFTYSPERSNLSPERFSPTYNSDYEKFQEIGSFDEYPVVGSDEKERERKDSSSSMSMKQYKDLQKEISQTLSKKDCCQLTRKTCRQLFGEHLQKLKPEDRKDICFKVAQLDLENAYGVLQNILISLSKNASLEDLQYSLFVLVSERVLAQEPSWYLGDFGLNLLKSAALRCPHRPILTRYIVTCIRSAMRSDSKMTQGKDSVFHEVDALGDTLLIACARRGDACADVLAEIARVEQHQPPLFRVNHVNADGASALHVACSEHSASSPRLHCAHVLLEHAGADLWQGDAKAGDTALHMAVNSRTCDLRLIMVLFRHLDRKVWKKLAHAPNMCSTTPLEYARSAMKSQSREGYPSEVLEFLKKCR